jgi:hypothetical protein
VAKESKTNAVIDRAVFNGARSADDVADGDYFGDAAMMHFIPREQTPP